MRRRFGLLFLWETKCCCYFGLRMGRWVCCLFCLCFWCWVCICVLCGGVRVCVVCFVLVWWFWMGCGRFGLLSVWGLVGWFCCLLGCSWLCVVCLVLRFLWIVCWVLFWVGRLCVGGVGLQSRLFLRVYSRKNEKLRFIIQ